MRVMGVIIQIYAKPLKLGIRKKQENVLARNLLVACETSCCGDAIKFKNRREH